MTLLDRTRAGLRSGVADRRQVEANLAFVRRAFALYADHLLRMVRLAPLDELLAEHRHHRDTEALLTNAREVVDLVADHFPDLAAAGQRLVGEALRYSSAVAAFIDRLLDEASTRRDFSMLDAEQYLTAALRSSRDELAEVFARTIFDPPALWITPDQVIKAVENIRPRTVRRRPPRPDAPSSWTGSHRGGPSAVSGCSAASAPRRRGPAAGWRRGRHHEPAAGGRLAGSRHADRRGAGDRRRRDAAI